MVARDWRLVVAVIDGEADLWWWLGGWSWAHEKRERERERSVGEEGWPLQTENWSMEVTEGEEIVHQAVEGLWSVSVID